MEWIGWFLLGLISGAVLMGLFQKWRAQGIQLRWYEYLLLAFGTILTVFGIETFVHSLAEMQPRAGWLSLLFMGVVAIVMFVILGRSLNGRSQT